MRTPESIAYTESRQEFLAEVHSLKRENTALRAELDAAKAEKEHIRTEWQRMCAELEEMCDRWRNHTYAARAELSVLKEELETALDERDESTGWNIQREAQIMALTAERDEARAFVESIVKADDNEMLSACWDEALIAVDRWNYNRPAPDTNRDGFTFADVNSPEFAELLSQVAHHGEHEPPIDTGDESGAA